MKKSSLIKIIFFNSLVLFICGTQLVKKSQFVDSLIYSGIAKDMALGKSTFWSSYDVSYIFNFRGHPPLAMFLQSNLFKIFNSDILPHAIFILLTLFLNVLGIYLLWNLLFPKIKKNVFIPIILWFLTPVVFWSFSNNILENTLSFFIVFSTYFCVKSIKSKKIIYVLIAVFFCFCAILTKGPVGLFPLIVLPIYWIIYKNNRALYFSIIFILALISSFYLLFLNNEAYIFFKEYINIQFLPSLGGKLDTNKWSHLYITQKLLVELIPMFLVAAIAYFMKKINFAHKKDFYFLIILGVLCSLPLSISPKAHGFYLVPCFSFFAIAFSSIIKININKINQLICKNSVLIISIVFLVTSIAFTINNFNKIDRDEDKIEFANAVRKKIPQNINQVYIADNLGGDFYLRALLTRYNSIRTERDKNFTYHIILTSDLINEYEILIQTNRYSLVKRK
jgi:hypothetical protein